MAGWFSDRVSWKCAFGASDTAVLTVTGDGVAGVHIRVKETGDPLGHRGARDGPHPPGTRPAGSGGHGRTGTRPRRRRRTAQPTPAVARRRAAKGFGLPGEPARERPRTGGAGGFRQAGWRLEPAPPSAGRNHGRRLGGSAARRLGGSAARRLGGSAARRLGGSAARRLGGSAARRLGGSAARRTL